MTGSSLYIQRLLESDALRGPLLGSIIHSLNLPPGSHGLDIGCGIGLQAQQLAGAVGPGGQVCGLDIDPVLLAFGEDLARGAGCSDRVTFRQGDFCSLPFDENSFDWVWSADCIGYPAGELASVLKELVRVVRPGGRILLLAWSSQQLLPGWPFLEARLNATCSGYLPYLRGMQPEHNFLQAKRWLEQAGLGQVRAQTFVGELQSPLQDGERAALTSLFEMLWGQRQPETSEEDWQAYRRLCQPGSPQFILATPGYYAFFTYTLFSGTVRKE